MPKNPTNKYMVRKISEHKPYGDQYGITIKSDIGKKVVGKRFSQQHKKDTIILKEVKE